MLLPILILNDRSNYSMNIDNTVPIATIHTNACFFFSLMHINLISTKNINGIDPKKRNTSGLKFSTNVIDCTHLDQLFKMFGCCFLASTNFWRREIASWSCKLRRSFGNEAANWGGALLETHVSPLRCGKHELLPVCRKRSEQSLFVPQSRLKSPLSLSYRFRVAREQQPPLHRCRCTMEIGWNKTPPKKTKALEQKPRQ